MSVFARLGDGCSTVTLPALAQPGRDGGDAGRGTASDGTVRVLVLPASGQSSGHAVRVLERAGFRVRHAETLAEARDAGAAEPGLCCVTQVEQSLVDHEGGASTTDAWIGGMTLAELERKAFLDTLDAHGGNRAATARALGVSEKTVYNKLRAWGLLTVR